MSFFYPDETWKFCVWDSPWPFLAILKILIVSRSGAPRLYSRGPTGFFGETRRSMSSFAKASEDTRYAFLQGFSLLRRSSFSYEGRAAVAFCEGG